MAWQQNPYGQNPSYPGPSGAVPYQPNAASSTVPHHPPPQGYNQGQPPAPYGAPSYPGGYGQQPVTAPGYVAPFAPPQGPPPGIQPELWNWFQAVDADRTGKINATELRSALMNGNNTTFGEGTCRLMIRMFDRDNSGQIDINEFSALWKYINDWRQCFERFDSDRSGNISAEELVQALNSFGYRLSPQFCQSLVRTYAARKTFSAGGSQGNTIVFDDFIEACVTIKNLTEVFSANDRNRQGVITVGFEQFLDMVSKVIV